MVKYVGGQETDLYEDYAGSVADWHLSLQGWSSAEALMLLQKRRREARLAAKEGDLTKLTRIGLKLESVRDNHKRTLLHVAAKFGQTEVVEYLLKEFKQQLVGQQDIDHFTAMDYAVAEKHDKVAQLIKDAGGGLTGEILRKGLTLAVRDLNLEVICSRSRMLPLPCVACSLCRVSHASSAVCRMLPLPCVACFLCRVSHAPSAVCRMLPLPCVACFLCRVSHSPSAVCHVFLFSDIPTCVCLCVCLCAVCAGLVSAGIWEVCQVCKGSAGGPAGNGQRRSKLGSHSGCHQGDAG